MWDTKIAKIICFGQYYDWGSANDWVVCSAHRHLCIVNLAIIFNVSLSILFILI